LSRNLAESGHFPAIDIEASVSRVMPDIASDEHMQWARELRRMYSLYQQNRDLISVGAYQPGADPRIDKAIEKNPAILEFLQQGMDEQVDLERSLRELGLLLNKRG
ncbi:MAG: flagellum-specific ATP synthase FliI, partial [Methylobacter sp.]